MDILVRRWRWKVRTSMHHSSCQTLVPATAHRAPAPCCRVAGRSEQQLIRGLKDLYEHICMHSDLAHVDTLSYVIPFLTVITSKHTDIFTTAIALHVRPQTTPDNAMRINASRSHRCCVLFAHRTVDTQIPRLRPDSLRVAKCRRSADADCRLSHTLHIRWSAAGLEWNRCLFFPLQNIAHPF